MAAETSRVDPSSELSPRDLEPRKTNDESIRASLKLELKTEYRSEPDTLVLDELGLRHGAARIDLAVVNGRLHGFELKSDRDTLRRLPKQIGIYNSVLDQVTLVVGEKHLRQAVDIIPTWWGVRLAKSKPGENAVQFENVRETSDNPSPDKLCIAKLLWREEALAILECLGAAEGIRSKPRLTLYSRLTEILNLGELCDRVRRQLRTRAGWRSGELRT
jgi:hypothetical protein